MKKFYHTHTNFGEDVQQKRQQGQKYSDSLTPETFVDVLWKSANLKRKMGVARYKSSVLLGR